jgi:hypothetical protein
VLVVVVEDMGWKCMFQFGVFMALLEVVLVGLGEVQEVVI